MPNPSGQCRTIKRAQASIKPVIPRIVAVSGLFLLTFVFMAPAARADCAPDTRKVALDNKLTVPMKSYRCKIGAGADAREIRVEFDRFSDVAAGLITSNGSSALLKKSFGAMTVVDNEISKTFRDLLKQFGTTNDTVKLPGESEMRFAISHAERAALPEEQLQTTVDKVGPAKFKSFNSDDFDYPAATESASLMKKAIPNDLSYYYAIDSMFCAEATPADFVCKKLGKKPVEMVFWKSLNSGDVTNYPKAVEAYNSLLMKVRKHLKEAKQDRLAPDLPGHLALMKFVGGENWPEDLLVAIGQHQTVECGTDDDLPGLAGWKFSVHARPVVMDAMVIENVSSQPISIGSLFGSRSATNALRVAREASGSSETVGSLSQTLPPGKRLLVPMRLVFQAPAELSGDLKNAEKSLDEVRTRFGMNGFSGREDALRIPKLNDYVWGPSISIGGLELNATRVDLEKPPVPNFVALTITSEAGSCPYLLSRAEDSDEWISYGKVLHKAPGRARQYTETTTFEGSRMTYRIEEREPEVAHIENIGLVVRLRDGTELSLRPGMTLGRQSVALPVDLMWGEAVEVDFTRPDGVASSDVVESRISITGYYERYAGLMAEMLSPPRLDVRAESLTSALRRQPERACFRKARLQ